MIYQRNPPKKLFRQYTPRAGYRIQAYRPTSKAIGPVMNAELKAMHAARKAVSS